MAYDFGTPILSNAFTDGNAPESEHDRRMQIIRDADPIYSTQLQNVIVNSLHNCQQNGGVERFAKLWASVDEEVLASLKKIIKLWHGTTNQINKMKKKKQQKILLLFNFIFQLFVLCFENFVFS